jgi:hypothetical protein
LATGNTSLYRHLPIIRILADFVRIVLEAQNDAPGRSASYDDANLATCGSRNDPSPVRFCLLRAQSRSASGACFITSKPLRFSGLLVVSPNRASVQDNVVHPYRTTLPQAPRDIAPLFWQAP